VTRRLLMAGVGFPYPDAISDYARDVAAGLDAEVEWVWPLQEGVRLSDALARDRALAAAARRDLRGWSVLLHWSPVNLGYRGMPMSSAGLPALLGRRGARVVTFLHELTEEAPGTKRSKVARQRRAVTTLAHGSARVVVTADERMEWLARNAPAAAKRADVIPLWSLVPVVPAPPRPAGDVPVLGMLGWNSAGCDPALVAGAVRHLCDGGTPARVLLVGRPGRHSEPGGRWAAAAGAEGVTFEFTGELPAEDVSRALGGVDVYLHVDATGALPRRVSFVTALAHGLPVVVLPSPVWRHLTPGTDVVVTSPTPAALADTVARLLDDPASRARVGDAARATYGRLLSRDTGLRRLGEALWPT
jgi:hypothetical protein